LVNLLRAVAHTLPIAKMVVVMTDFAWLEKRKLIIEARPEERRAAQAQCIDQTCDFLLQFLRVMPALM
jgi:hypothetical protein